MDGRKLVLLVFLMLFSASCAPDPRKEAQAEKIRLEAEQAAKDAEQMRSINARKEADEAARAAWWRSVWDACLQSAKNAMNMFVNIILFSLAVSVSVILLGAGWTVKETTIGVGRALVQFAEVRANSIYLDKTTRTFPMLRQVHGSRWALAIPNINAVLMLDEKNSPDRQLIAALAQVSTAGVLADAASNPKADAAGIAMIQPTVIDIQA